MKEKGRLILKGGRVIDPKNHRDGRGDVAVLGDRIAGVGGSIRPEKGDRVINCEKLMVWPGLVDMHLHIGDLFEMTTASAFCAARDGVTAGLSPGAGNTFMAPALLGAEIDRGMPINAGVYLGAGSVLSSSLSDSELVCLFRGTLSEKTAMEKLTRNRLTNMTAPYVMGIKDHMGHFIMSNEKVDRLFDITQTAGLIYMSHTQDPVHTERMVECSRGRYLHLAHTNAAGCGSHMGAVEGMQAVLKWCGMDFVTGEFVTTMLREGLGSREGLQMTPRSRQLALDALESGIVKILVSDGQNDAVMKGFGDTRDNIPCILELAEEGILPLSDLVAAMTCNPVKLIAERTGNRNWTKEFGHLGEGAFANITVVDSLDKLATYTIVNGKVASFENRLVRKNLGSGYWVSKFGVQKEMGVGCLGMYEM